nr:hypothetical protein GCM10020092_059930 [Actinoplanes digitatis]
MSGSTTAVICWCSDRSYRVVACAAVPYAAVSVTTAPAALNSTRRTVPSGWVTRVAVTFPAALSSYANW